MLNKKAQVGETATWLVATLIIVVLLSISLYASSALGKTKKVSSTDSLFSLGYSKTRDYAMQESLFTYFTLNNSGNKTELLKDLENKSEEDYFYDDFDSNFKKIKFVLNDNG